MKFNDYFSTYSSIFEDSKKAMNNVNEHGVVKNILSQLTTCSRLLSGSKELLSPYEEDATIATFNEGFNNQITNINNLTMFLSTYTSAEDVYIKLYTNLDTLKQATEKLKGEFDNKPNINDNKYKLDTSVSSHSIFTTDSDSINRVLYRRDLSNWENRVRVLDNDCQKLVMTIDEFIKFLENVDGLSPSDGTGNVVIPTSGKILFGDLAYNKIINSHLAFERQPHSYYDEDKRTTVEITYDELGNEIHKYKGYDKSLSKKYYPSDPGLLEFNNPVWYTTEVYDKDGCLLSRRIEDKHYGHYIQETYDLEGRIITRSGTNTKSTTGDRGTKPTLSLEETYEYDETGQLSKITAKISETGMITYGCEQADIRDVVVSYKDGIIVSEDSERTIQDGEQYKYITHNSTYESGSLISEYDKTYYVGYGAAYDILKEKNEYDTRTVQTEYYKENGQIHTKEVVDYTRANVFTNRDDEKSITGTTKTHVVKIDGEEIERSSVTVNE